MALPSSTSSTILRNSLVGCNVYVSSAASKRIPLLLDLLSQSQQRCKVLRTKQQPHNNDNDSETEPRRRPPSKVAIVHAYGDVPYDRSSFHLAGRGDLVAEVATSLALGALDGLRDDEANNNVGNGESDEVEERRNSSRHPFVGLVDHVSVMPLLRDPINKRSAQLPSDSDSSSSSPPTSTSGEFVPADGHGIAARHIGHHLSSAGVNVLYYGSAHPEAMPLATIRRNRTNFFRSGGLLDKAEKSGTATANDGSVDTSSDTTRLGVATVGSPSTFVENYNVRLTSHCTRPTAIMLAKRLRERDGGLPGVEALTLPYSDDRWEVACNLLQPNIGSAEEVQRVVDEWSDEQRNIERGTTQSEDSSTLVEIGYRVGTTASQCLEVIELEEEEMEEYDWTVRSHFLGNLMRAR